MIDYEIRPIDRKTAKHFIETWHYSKSINGVSTTYCFGLFDKEELIGAMIIGYPSGREVLQKYNDNGRLNVLEIRRLACVDDTKRNTESYFLGAVLRWLKKNTNIDRVLAYSDPYYGHTGIIYRAANFKLIARIRNRYKFLLDGKTYNLRTFTRKTPSGDSLRQAFKDGQIDLARGDKKYLYSYDIRRN